MADLTIIRGDDYRVVVTLASSGSPFDLTGYTVAAQIRPTYNTNAALTAAFTATIDADPTTGIITLELDHDATAALTTNGFWDLEITDDQSWVTTVVGGTVTISPDITRPVVP